MSQMPSSISFISTCRWTSIIRFPCEPPLCGCDDGVSGAGDCVLPPLRPMIRITIMAMTTAPIA